MVYLFHYLDYKKKVEPLLLHHNFTNKNAFSLDKQFIKFYLKDGFYASEDFSSYSLTPLPNFFKWSELRRNKFNWYSLNDNHLMEPETCPKLSFDTVRKALLSKDLDSFEV